MPSEQATAAMIRDHVKEYWPRMRSGQLHSWAIGACDLLSEFAAEREREEAEDAADAVVADARADEEAVRMALVAEAELIRLRAFAEAMADVFDGKDLGDEALLALGREPSRPQTRKAS